MNRVEDRAVGSIRSLALLGFVVAALAPLPSCRTTPVDNFELSIPGDLKSEVTWYEVGVFPGPGCAALAPQLPGGIPAAGYVQRLAFPASDGSPPGIGDLPRAKYAIGVAARAADCTVLATGCTDVDLSQASTVTVVLNAVATPAGACTNGATCEDAECTPGNADLGAGCSLAFVGAGPLADPLGLDGTVMSAPALAATAAGFLVAYREWDPNTGDARITVIPVDEQGGIGTPQQTLQAACLTNQLSDAAGLAFAGTSGTVAAARAGCADANGAGDSGIDLATVDGNGDFSAATFGDLGQLRVFLSTAHAMAQSSAGTFLAYTQANLANVSTLSGGNLGPTTIFGGNGAMADAWVAASDNAVALLARSVAGGPSAGDDGGSGDGAASDEAGAGSNESGAPTTSEEASTSGGSTLNFNLISSAGTSPSFASLGAPSQFPGNWGAVTVLAGRAFVASDGQSADEPLAYRAFDVGSAAPSVVAAYNPEGTGPVLFADVASRQDHLFFAVERPGAITLDAFENATTTPTLLREVPLSGDARIPLTSDVRDGRVAVLATDTRVIVAWTTQEVLASDDATGGFAVFACTTP